MNTPKTSTLKGSEVSRDWYVVDASQTTLGRLSTVVAQKLTGKHKASYTPHIDNGDFVVVINADQLKVTGNKTIEKKYHRHSQHPGSLKTATLGERMAKEDSTGVVTDAVKGMLPKNKLQRDRIARLKVYNGSDHPHGPQNPKQMELQ